MPTRRAAVPDADTPDDGRDLVPTAPGVGAIYDPADDDDPLTALRMKLAAMEDGEFKTKVYRFVGGELEWLFDTTFAEWEESGMNNLRATYGPGKYQLRVYGRPGLIGKPTVRIGGAAPSAPVAVAAPPAQSPELAAVLAGIVEMQRATLDALGRMQAQPVTPPDPLAGIRQMTEVLSLMKQLQPPPPPAVDPMAMMNQVLATVRSVREVAQEIEPPPESDSPMALAAKGLDLIGTLARNGAANPGGAVPQENALSPLTLPSSLDQSATGDDTDETGDDMNPIQLMILRGHLQTIIDMEGKQPVNSAGEYLLAKLPDEFAEYLKLPTWFEILSQFYPQAAQHQAWLSQVRAFAVSRLNG